MIAVSAGNTVFSFALEDASPDELSQQKEYGAFFDGGSQHAQTGCPALVDPRGWLGRGVRSIAWVPACWCTRSVRCSSGAAS